MKIMVSACLLGENCKYNGGNNLNSAVLKFVEGHSVFLVCPEVMGGLPTPRAPGEIVDGTVKTAEGISVDREYRTGAAMALEMARSENIDVAVLQSRSPSCGVNMIYDGTFTGVKIPGKGVFAQLLSDNGFKVIDAEDLL